MTDYVSLLRSIGLNESEAKVYLTNLEIGPAPAHILVKRSGFSRPATYQAIDILLEKGLITSVLRGKRNVYIAESPERLLNFGDVQVQHLQSQVNDLRSVIDTLKLMQRGDRPVMRFVEGLDGLKMILRDIADTQPESTTEITNVDALGKVFSIEELKEVQGTLSDLKIEGRALLAGKVGSIRKGVKARVLPGNIFNFSGDFIAYGNKLAIVSFTEKLIGVVIESQVIADTFRTLFNFAWVGAQDYPVIEG
ncbi:MAG: helix-turn-helix domain-containing protein [Patescibacteria group bacterium]